MIGAILPIAIFWGIVWDSQPAGLIKTLKFGLLSGYWSVLKLRCITPAKVLGNAGHAKGLSELEQRPFLCRQQVPHNLREDSAGGPG